MGHSCIGDSGEDDTVNLVLGGNIWCPLQTLCYTPNLFILRLALTSKKNNISWHEMVTLTYPTTSLVIPKHLLFIEGHTEECLHPLYMTFFWYNYSFYCFIFFDIFFHNFLLSKEECLHPLYMMCFWYTYSFYWFIFSDIFFHNFLLSK